MPFQTICGTFVIFDVRGSVAQWHTLHAAASRVAELCGVIL